MVQCTIQRPNISQWSLNAIPAQYAETSCTRSRKFDTVYNIIVPFISNSELSDIFAEICQTSVTAVVCDHFMILTVISYARIYVFNMFKN